LIRNYRARGTTSRNVSRHTPFSAVEDMATIIFLLLFAWTTSVAAYSDDHDGLFLLQRSVERVSQMSGASGHTGDAKTQAESGQAVPAMTQCSSRHAACVMKLKRITQNDLDAGKGAVRFADVCSVHGESFDLEITASEAYHATDAKNGIHGDDIAVINSKTTKWGGVATFTFSFLKSGTNRPGKVDSVDITLYDIDGAGGKSLKGWLETAAITGYTSFRLDPHTRLLHTVNKGVATFTSNTALIPNPTHAQILSQVQKFHSIQVRYESVSKFNVSWGVHPAKGGPGPNMLRHFFFAGVAALKYDCR